MTPQASSGQFHNKPFTEETITKLDIFQLYAREWLPVFLSNPNPPFAEIHIFDFFSGPGVDSNGEPGSPLRLAKELGSCKALAGFEKTKIHLHLFDAKKKNIKQLQENIAKLAAGIPSVVMEIEPLSFEEAFKQRNLTLSKKNTAKLILIDQFGVDMVTDEIFQSLIKFPTCDFLFFIASSTLHRFRNHPSIKQKIDRPQDPYHVHREVLNYYKRLIPIGTGFSLSSFSIKKPPNIYGLIFGSAHPLGMDKFLQVAWKKDSLSGEANFDIDRDNIQPTQPLLDLDGMGPTKQSAFEKDLELKLREKSMRNESAIIAMCHDYGMTRQHAKPVLAQLKKEGLLEADFQVPDIKRWNNPRPIRYK